MADNSAIETVIAGINMAEKASDGTRFALTEREWNVMFIRSDGKTWSPDAWKEGLMVLHLNDTWYYQADCSELCGLEERHGGHGSPERSNERKE